MLKYDPRTEKYGIPYSVKLSCEGIANLVIEDFLTERFQPKEICTLHNETTVGNHADTTYIVDGKVFDFEIKSARVPGENGGKSGMFVWTEHQYQASCQSNNAYVFVGKSDEGIQWVIIAQIDIKMAVEKGLLSNMKKSTTAKRLGVNRNFANGRLRNRDGITQEMKVLKKYEGKEVHKIIRDFISQDLEMGTF